MNEELKWAASDRYLILKEYARQNRLNPTDAELILWRELREKTLGTKFFRQYVIADYIVDFVSLQHRIIIEVDGAYHLETKSHENDVIRSERLESLGFQILRFTNDEIFNKLEQVLTTIKKHLYEF
ncbi:MAG: endonuclease domain-containing protein [Bacteroidaceae bacterium]|nr:endonuclease domain-containing protein [Bacteroidaceae bacterium]